MFIYELPLEIQLSRKEGCVPTNQFSLPHFCACPKQDLYFQGNIMSWSPIFCVQPVKVRGDYSFC